MDDPSKPNSDGITALHNAVCASHDEVVKFLVQYGCNINSQDSHGWYETSRRMPIVIGIVRDPSSGVGGGGFRNIYAFEAGFH